MKAVVFSGVHCVTYNISVSVSADETWWFVNLICIMDEAWETVPDGWRMPWANRKNLLKPSAYIGVALCDVRD